eukprot:14304-Heterococcus_DN1.PRE.2
MALAAVRARVIYLISQEPLRLQDNEAAQRADEYIKFMQLKAEQATAPLAPSHAVDQVWHNHILDTRSYQQLQTALMPDGGFIHHNPVHAEQPNYGVRYANTLSLLTVQYGNLDAASWGFDNSEYKKLNIMVVSANSNTATAGPQVYCHKRHTVLQLVESIKLVMGYAATDRIIITGMTVDYLPKSTQRVSLTEVWSSAIVRVTPVAATGGVNGSMTSTGDNSVKHLRFQDVTAEIKVDVSAHGTAKLINLVPDEVLNVQADGHNLQDIQLNLVHPDEEYGSCSMQAANSSLGYNAFVKDVVEKASTHRYGTSTNGSVVIQISFVSQAPTFTVQIEAIQKHGGIEVRETDTVAFLFYKCCVFYRRYAASCDLKVYKNGVDLATLDQESTLADVDINGTTKLHAEADAGNAVDISHMAITLMLKGSYFLVDSWKMVERYWTTTFTMELYCILYSGLEAAKRLLIN